MTSTIKVDTIREKTSANGVAIDSVTLKDGAVTATAASTITVTDNSDTLSLISTDADANAGPILRLFRNSASPADDDVAGSIVFSGEDDAGNETDYASIKVITEDVTNTTEDGRLSFNIIDGGSEKEVMSIFDDFVGIGTTAPEQVLHVHGGDSGSSYSTDSADRLIIENNDSLRIDIRTGDTNTAGIMFSDTTRNVGSINYSHNSNEMTLNVNSNGNHGLRIDSSNNLSTNGETAPYVALGGLCLNQGANDDNILTLKSSDIAHGITATAETDTYFEIRKQSGSIGGAELSAYGEQKLAYAIQGFVGLAEESSPSAASFGPVYVNCSIKSGSSIVEMSAAQHLFVVANDGDAKFMVDGDGTFHSDGSGGTYDTYEDAQLVRAFDLSHKEGVINSKFDKFVQYNHEDLAEAKLVGRNPDGTPNYFINYPAFNRLHNGAIWQQYEKHQKLANAVYELAKAAVGEDKANEILEQNDIKLLN